MTSGVGPLRFRGPDANAACHPEMSSRQRAGEHHGGGVEQDPAARATAIAFRGTAEGETAIGLDAPADAQAPEANVPHSEV